MDGKIFLNIQYSVEDSAVTYTRFLSTDVFKMSLYLTKHYAAQM
jgi:hypothetical protein